MKQGLKQNIKTAVVTVGFITIMRGSAIAIATVDLNVSVLFQEKLKFNL